MPQNDRAASGQADPKCHRGGHSVCCLRGLAEQYCETAPCEVRARQDAF
ncbi:hypothetical protein SH528x_001287 [Novipirellula sp. SH528]